MILLIWLMLFWSYFTHLSAELQIRQIGLVPWESQRELLQPAGKWGSEPTEHEDFTITNQFLLHCVSVILFHQDNVFFCNLTEKKTARFAFAGRWIGLTIANYIVNRWKQTLINTNWKITDKPASSRFILGVVVWASDILLVRSENMEEHMNSASNNGIWTKTNSIQHSNPIGWSSSNVLPGLVNFFLHNELERKSPFKERLNQHKSTISPCSIAIWMYV
jgi:hypothetical protein